jgi:hypothetical protein
MTKMHLMLFWAFSPHAGLGPAALPTLLPIDLSPHVLDHRSPLRSRRGRYRAGWITLAPF